MGLDDSRYLPPCLERRETPVRRYCAVTTYYQTALVDAKIRTSCMLRRYVRDFGRRRQTCLIVNKRIMLHVLPPYPVSLCPCVCGLGS